MFTLNNLNKKLFICAMLLCIPNLNAEAVQMEAPSVTFLQTENIDKKYTYRDAFLKTHEKTYSLKHHYLMTNTIELTTPTDNRTDNANKTTEKIEGRFERINSSSNGGAISNTGTGKIENINSDFVLNSIYSETSKYGGAIYNKPSDKTTGITTIVGDFIHNEVYVYGNDYEEANGGAIFNNGTIQSITGDFLSNNAISDYNYGVGGAIYNEYNGTISSINGNFGYNQALGQYSQAGAIYNAGTINTINGDFYLNRIKGNDWNQGGAIRNSGEITTINGTFYLNQISGEDIARGGGIYNEGIIKDITGDFYNNLITVKASAPVPVNNTVSPAMARGTINYGDGNALVAGGAIYNTYELDNIKGNFVNNNITAEASQATGGALTNTAQIKNIEGHFIENNINALNAQGGAISNTGEIGLISGDFVNNYVIGSSIAQGGAIYTFWQQLWKCR